MTPPDANFPQPFPKFVIIPKKNKTKLPGFRRPKKKNVHNQKHSNAYVGTVTSRQPRPTSPYAQQFKQKTHIT